jgi:UDP-N-acetylmuramoylalanine-D-glutamate ligase
VGTPILEAVLHPEPYDVIAVELSSFQLHWSRSVSAVASACLNVAPDHLDWHGSLEEYQRAKGRIYENTQVACIYNVQDPVTEQLVMDADVVEGCRAVGFTLGVPALSMVGLVDDVLADRAFVEQRQTSAAELCTLADLQGEAPSVAPHYVANALAAAASGRSPSATACARSAPTPTASPTSPLSVGCASSTTPRPPTRMPPPPRCWPSSTWSGSPGGSSRAPTSTSSSPRRRTGCAGWC